MTQKFYLHDATTTDTGTLPVISVSTTGPDGEAAGARTNRVMDETIGVGPQVEGLCTGNVANKWLRRFVSAPLAAHNYSVGGSWVVHIAGSDPQSLNATFFQLGCLALWRPSTGLVIVRIVDLAWDPDSVLFGTTETAVTTGGFVGSSFNAAAGDILVFEAWTTGSSNGSSNVREYYDGTTEDSASTNAAYLLAPYDILMGPPPGPPPTPGFFSSEGHPGPRMT